MNKMVLTHIVEAALMASQQPLSISQIQSLFDDADMPSVATLRDVMTTLMAETEHRGIELIEVASGFRYQVRSTYAPWVSRLWQERPPRYSRALLETLALIAYRQPITRGEIEDVRGVVVSSQMIRTLLEREWIHVVGYKEVPGRPALYATTAQFLDYFGLQHLQQLPTLTEIQSVAAQEYDDRQRSLMANDAATSSERSEHVQRSLDEVVAHEVDVLQTTAEELATAEALLAQVEKNVFNSGPSDHAKSSVDFGGLLARQQEREQRRMAQTHTEPLSDDRSVMKNDVISAEPSKPSGEENDA
ncbi:MAG: SMC-Scp complex subunit ScpB [Bacterioplanes sp.]|nr:SMC-Scp complex subunit ScpB [Bacterioplanes sp.]